MSAVASAEFEALIPSLVNEDREVEVCRAMHRVPGIEAVATTIGAIWIGFRPEEISRKEICRKLRGAGFPPEMALEDGAVVEC